MNKRAKDSAWQEAKKKYRLSNDVVMMAKRLGMNPKKLGSLANHRQEPWKSPLPGFIRDCYQRRFGEQTRG